MLEEEANNQLMWKTEPQSSSLSTTARLMNILEAKHRWKSAAPWGSAAPAEERQDRQHQPAGEAEDKEHELSGGIRRGGLWRNYPNYSNLSA